MTKTRIEPKDVRLDVGGTGIHFLDWGTDGKPPFVLLHGFSSQAHYWDALSVRVREERHVYAIDQRGHGESDWATDYGPESMPNDLLAVVDHLGLDTFALLGHSMGGGVAMRFAAQHPERVERLIIVDIGLPAANRPISRDNSVTRALAKDTFDNEAALMDHYQQLAPALDIERVRKAIMYNFRTLDDGRVTYRFDPDLRNRLLSPEGIEANRIAAEELRARIHKVTCPTLVIRGELSDILLPDAAKATAAAFPNGNLVEIPRTTHMIPTDDPVAFRTVVREFLGLPA